MSPGLWQIIIIILFVILFFGKGKISTFMADLGKGMKSFKEGMDEEKTEPEKLESQKVTKKPSVKKTVTKKAAPKKKPVKKKTTAKK